MSYAMIVARDEVALGCLTLGLSVVGVSGGRGLKLGRCSNPLLCLILFQLFVALSVAVRAFVTADRAALIA